MDSDNSITICFPESFPADASMDEVLQQKNEDIRLYFTENKQLTISEKAFAFSDVPYLEFYLPHNITESQLNEFVAANNTLQYVKGVRQVGFEWNGNNLIFIKMGTFAIISAITMAIGAGLFFWATKNKRGRVYTEEGEYSLSNPQNSNCKERRKPDVSYISYEQVPENIQNSWTNSFIDSPPTLAIEVVSTKKGLEKELSKMKQFWMTAGARIGLVVCPFTKTIYIFESGKPMTTQSVYQKFTHPLLPGYQGDFSAYMNTV